MATCFTLVMTANIGFETKYNKLKMLSARDYIRTAKQLGFSVVDGGYDSNFQDAITRTGFVQNHHIAFSGGTNDGNYRASVV